MDIYGSVVVESIDIESCLVIVVRGNFVNKFVKIKFDLVCFGLFGFFVCYCFVCFVWFFFRRGGGKSDNF